MAQPQPQPQGQRWSSLRELVTYLNAHNIVPSIYQVAKRRDGGDWRLELLDDNGPVGVEDLGVEIDVDQQESGEVLVRVWLGNESAEYRLSSWRVA